MAKRSHVNENPVTLATLVFVWLNGKNCTCVESGFNQNTNRTLKQHYFTVLHKEDENTQRHSL